MDPITLKHGQFHFNVEMENGETVPATIDVLELKLLCEELEYKHHLEKNPDGSYKSSTDFLRDLAAQLALAGVPSPTVTLAYQLWHVAGAKLNELKKNINDQLSSRTGSDRTPASSPTTKSSDTSPT